MNPQFSDRFNLDEGTLQRDTTPPVDSNPAWDMEDVMNNVKV